MDVFEPGPGPQLHDLNPSAAPPTGLFWTTEIPAEGVDVDLGQGTATMQATNVPILDYREIPNALLARSPPIPGTVSFRVQWSGALGRTNVRNQHPVYGGFAGEFMQTRAQMDWTATVGDFQFASAPLETSTSSFAELGQERNGIFFA